MQFDPFTFVAQLINFAILLVLLQRFLYKPILSIMAEREAQLAERFQAAERQAQEGQRAAAEYRQQRAELDEQRADLLAEAHRAAEEERRSLQQVARTEAEALTKRWRAAIAHEEELFLRELRGRVAGQVFCIARQTLADLAQVDLETAVVARFIERVQREAPAELAHLRDQPPQAAATIHVCSAFALSDALRDGIETTLRDLLASDDAPHDSGETLRIDFDTDADLICGIELRLREYRLAWSVRDYLDEMEADLRKALD